MDIKLLEKTLNYIESDYFTIPSVFSALKKELKKEYYYHDEHIEGLVKTWIKLGVMVNSLKVIQPTAIDGFPAQISMYYFPHSHILNKKEIEKDIIFDFYVSYIDGIKKNNVTVGLGEQINSVGGGNLNTILTMIKNYVNADKKAFFEALTLGNKIGTDIDNLVVLTVLGFNNLRNANFSVGDFNFLSQNKKLPMDVRLLLLNSNAVLEKMILEMDSINIDLQNSKRYRI